MDFNIQSALSLISLAASLAAIAAAVLIVRRTNDQNNEDAFLEALMEVRRELKEEAAASEARTQKTLSAISAELVRSSMRSESHAAALSSAIEVRMAKLEAQVSRSLALLAESSAKASLDNSALLTRELEKMRESNGAALEKLRSENQTQMEEIRRSVQEKLDKTLSDRLAESFRIVDEKLGVVQSGLGEMRLMAEDVSRLKNILANVKTRGTFGEVQLESILSEVFTQEQYASQIDLAGEGTKCDFAVKMPGRGDEPCWLPIDSKFPLEDWEVLQSALDDGDKEAAAAASKALERAIVKQAKSIAQKYVRPPKTTEFAVMFLPSESLYAEVLRIPGLFDRLQNEMRVTPAGPVVFTALVNSLLMGFATLAMEKQSSEVWRILAEVKREFENFSRQYSVVEKKFQEAQNSLAAMSTRKNQMDKKMKAIESAAAGSLPIAEEDESLALH